MACIPFAPRTTSALLWGAVGFMAFLVLVQGYALLAAPLVSITQGVAIAALVAIGTAVGAYVLEHRIAEWAARRTTNPDESPDGADGKSKS